MANKYDDDYTRVTWENLPSHNTPINQQNLNNMDAQIKVLTTRVSDMSAYIPNVMYVDELPEQGVEGLLYVVSLIEHAFELDGLPDRFKTQSAYNSWVTDYGQGCVLHTTSDTYPYILIEGVQILCDLQTNKYIVSGTPQLNADHTLYYYDIQNKEWITDELSNLDNVSVNDVLFGLGTAISTAYLSDIAISTELGDNTDFIGLECVLGGQGVTPQYYDDTMHNTSVSNNQWEIYQAKPIRVLDPRNVYMWNDDTHSFFGFQKEYEAGQNITFTQQGTKVIISATGGGSGVEDTVVTFTYNKTEGTVTCDTLWQDIINKYNAKTLKVQIREIQRNSAITRTVNLTQFKYGGGTTNDMYFEYLEGNILTTYKVIKNPNPNLEEYTITTITKDISGGGGGSDVIVPIYYRDDTDNTLKCTMSFDEIYAYYSHTSTSISSTNCLMPQFIDDQQDERFDCVQIKETTRNNKQCIMFAFRHWYLGGDTDAKTAYDFKVYHFYDDTIGTAGAYQSYTFQTELTSANAGSGISITQVNGKPVISVNYPNGDIIEY